VPTAKFRDRQGKEQDLGDDEEVHWVVVSGNASRYPLIAELLRKNLRVSSIEDGRFDLDIDNLKHAVAKGAALALASLTTRGMMRVEFESDLSECLPYDITYWNPGANSHLVLFREHDRYDQLKPARVRILPPKEAPGAPQNLSREVPLERHWPGDIGSDAYVGFLRFRFNEGIQGEVEIRYDPENEFVAKDIQSGVEVIGEPMGDPDVYVSPVQRGTL
jgi:hypothetical protein